MSYWDFISKIYEAFIPKEWKKAQTKTAENIDGPVLEVGCGTGYLTEYLLSKGYDVTAIDISEQMIRRTKQKLEQKGLPTSKVMRADIIALPFDDKSFDYSISSGTIGLISEKEKALIELNRVSRKEIRLLEPIEEKEGFYWKRIWTFFVDGHAPIQLKILDKIEGEKEIKWKTMYDIFTYMIIRKKL
jgi:ubiquinone/menaquinone biosynthesis C-methylase UbiE